MNNDLISRSALIEWFSPYMHEDEAIPPDVVILDIKAAPAVDAVKVVRCGACKNIENSPYGRYCTVWHGHNGMGDEGYCNYGERKTDG